MRPDQVSGGVGVLCWQAVPFAHVLWKLLEIRFENDEEERILSCTCTVLCYIFEYMYI